MQKSAIQKNGEDLALTVLRATHGWERMRGLLGHRQLPPNQAMFLAPGASIHTWFMRFSIDLVFVDRPLSITRIIPNVPPWRMAFGGRNAWGVLEMAAGAADAFSLTVGDVLTFSEFASVQENAI